MIKQRKKPLKKVDTVQRNFVKELQKLVHKYPKASQDFKKRVDVANKKLNQELKEIGQPKVNLKLNTEQTMEGTPSVRVTCPTTTILSANVKPDGPFYTEFYQTRSGKDGVSETNFLGTAKYSNADGKRSISFLTERFSRKPSDPLILHAEVLDKHGSLLAANALAVIV